MTADARAQQAVSAAGATIPSLGFGTFELDRREATDAVATALEVGYRHVDTAQIYGNEAEVGGAIADSDIAREHIWLTTKVWPENFAPPEFRPSVEKSLDRLGVDYVDLLLLHWPNDDVPLAETIEQLNDVRREGLAHQIGVSNFPSALLAEAAALSDAPLATNQVEYHPFLSQSAVLSEARNRGMALTAYSPLARGEVFEDATLGDIGEAHGKHAGQVALRWLIQQDGVIAIPRSADPDHIASNFEIFDFELTDAEVERITGLTAAHRRLIDPKGLAPDWDR